MGRGDYQCSRGNSFCVKSERAQAAPGSIPDPRSGLFGRASFNRIPLYNTPCIYYSPSYTALLASQSIYLFSFLVFSLLPHSFSSHVLRSQHSIQSHRNKSSLSSTVAILCRCGFIYDRSLSYIQYLLLLYQHLRVTDVVFLLQV